MTASEDCRILVDPAAGPDAGTTLEAAGAPSVGEVAEALEAVLAVLPEAEVVGLVVGGIRIGATSRAYLDAAFGLRAGRGETGDAAGMTLPGPGHFRLLRYQCSRSGCPRAVVRMYHDEEHPPVCPEHRTAMELLA
ncbi:hypothetical protein [Catenulispora subtropica]|uniref:Uncharacterized protein n=1 Tax=Catenulispora subtropica TaxID=450798 RepID=A0ABP5EN80_9ACTN